MLVLKDLRYVGDRELEEWIRDVKGKAGEVANLGKELGELKSGTDPGNINVRLELTMKVVEVLKDIRLLKQEANAHPESLENLLLELGIEKPKQYSYEDLSSFTSNFSIKVGQGAFAHVYKGHLPKGVQVAVKVLIDHDVVKEMFMAEVRTVGRTYHQNLIKLYGFCFDQTKKALVYEYMENGSLDRVLYENHHSIEWEKLYSIATDIAKAIACLHDGCSEQIIHHDIKPANVLLDSNFSPKVTDFGLAKLLNRDKSHITLTGIRGTPGYLAPEMWMPESLVTYKCDVYSYGMLLFEVLGRRKNLRNNNQWFPKQVWEKFEVGQLDEIIDDCGIRESNREKATILTMVAIWCAQFTAQVRPTMSTVVKMLEKEISITMPPNPFFPSNFVSSLQTPHLPEVNHPNVAAPVTLQPSHFPEEIRPNVAAISLQPPDMAERGLQSLSFQGLGVNPWLQQGVDPSVLRNEQSSQYQAIAAAALQDIRNGDPLKQQYLQFQQPYQYLQQPSGSSPVFQQQIMQQALPQQMLNEQVQNLVENQPQHLLQQQLQQQLQLTLGSQQKQSPQQQQQQQSFQESFQISNNQFQQQQQQRQPQQSLPDLNISFSVSLHPSSIQNMLSSMGPGGSGNLLNLLGMSESMLSDQRQQQRWVQQYPYSQGNPFEGSASLQPILGKDGTAEADNCGGDVQPNTLFGVNIDSSPHLLSSVIPNLGSSSVDADVSTTPFGASSFQNSLYPMDDSSDMFNGAGQVEPLTRNFVKVYKSGSVGRSLDIGRFSSYHELREELGRMFGVEAQLDDPLRSGWQLVFVDGENDVLLLGDCPLDSFVNNVWYIEILSPEDIQNLGNNVWSKTKQ